MGNPIILIKSVYINIIFFAPQTDNPLGAAPTRHKRDCIAILTPLENGT